MISYELAKELKDAGFPQSLNDYKHLFSPKCDEREKYPHGLKLMGETEICDCVVAAPTLEELIEACREEFGQLVRFQTKNYTTDEIVVKWRAEHSELEDIQDGRGKTPSEAVALLYLALHGDGNTS